MTKLPNEFFKHLKDFSETPDSIYLKEGFKIRHFVAFPTSFNFEELGELNQGDNINPLLCGNYHGVGRTSASNFTLRKDIYFMDSPSIFELNGGRTESGFLIPTSNLGSINVHVFSVPLRTLSIIDNIFWNTTANTRKEFNISMFSDRHDIHNFRSWIYIANEDHNPDKYMNPLNAPEADYTRETGYSKKKVYK